jgi:hypothetical protein
MTSNDISNNISNDMSNDISNNISYNISNHMFRSDSILYSLFLGHEVSPFTTTRFVHLFSHAALPMITLQISSCTNVTLTFDFDCGLDHLVHGGYGWGSPTQRRRTNCQTKKLKSGYGPHWGPGTKTNWPTDRQSQCNFKLNLRHYTANYRPVLSSERAPYMKK